MSNDFIKSLSESIKNNSSRSGLSNEIKSNEIKKSADEETNAATGYAVDINEKNNALPLHRYTDAFTSPQMKAVLANAGIKEFCISEQLFEKKELADSAVVASFNESSSSGLSTSEANCNELSFSKLNVNESVVSNTIDVKNADDKMNERQQPEGGMMFEMMDGISQSAVIKVIGVGGGGGNAVKHMVNSGIDGVDFVCANTDAQALQDTLARTIIQMGSEVTKGLGAGANPDIGREAAMEDRARIAEMIQGTDMLFITAGMGGGTGTGAAPVIAELAREMGILTVAVVTKPFPFEGAKRMALAMQGIDELSKHVDSLITVPNEKLLSVLGREATLLSAFAEANNVLLYAVQGIAELITCPGLINVDFADVRTVMSEMGMAMMGAGQASGPNRAEEATAIAIASPLLEEVDLAGAKGILVNVTAGLDMGIGEFDEVGQMIQSIAANDATVVIGTTVDPELQDQLRVTVVATGIGGTARQLQSVRSTQNIEVERAARPVRTATQAAAPATTAGNNGGYGATSTKPTTASATVTSNGSASAVNYNNLDRPTVLRQATRAQKAGPAGPAAAAVVGNINEEAYESVLDIPAFLRRQAD